MYTRHLLTRISVLSLLAVALLLPTLASAETLDACELDLDRRSQQADDCEIHERSPSWIRLGHAPDGAGLLQSGSLVGQLQLTPAASTEVRLAQIQPTQPTVWVSSEETWATLMPNEWIDVVLVRQGSPDTYAVAVLRQVTQGLTISSSVLATSASFTQSGALSLSVGWSFSQGQLTVLFTGPGSTTLSVQQSGFGSSLPWLNVPHFPQGNADVSAVSLLSLSGSAQ
jgi:hypothetical protein